MERSVVSNRTKAVISHFQRTALCLIFAGAGASAAAPLPSADAPCESSQSMEPREPEVQVGVRIESRPHATDYVYTVLNRGRDTLTVVSIGYDTDRDGCGLTGASPHALPDTTFSPPGWECEPSQGEHDSVTFCVSWKPASHSTEATGILPSTSLSGFTVRLPKPDTLYDCSHWFIRFKTQLQMAYVGALRPEAELDLISAETGAISGRVTDNRGVGIPGAIVFVWQSNLSARTEEDGSYTIPGVPVGGQSLAARVTGFEPCDRLHVGIAANRTTKINFHLTPADVSTPCVPLTVARDRTYLPFPGDLVDTVGARFLDRRSPLPKSPGGVAKPRPSVYSLTSREISLMYPGIGQDTTRRAFVVSIRRSFRNPEEERLIRIAEETYPPPEAILAIAGSRPGPEALSKEKRLWWYDSFDGVRLPYAVTMDAVRYYLTLSQALARGDTTETGIRMKRSEFSYHASIAARPSTYSRDGRVFKDVYVVNMGLTWSNYCGSECACWFRLDRTVVLRPDGTVLCVFGDQKPMVIVS